LIAACFLESIHEGFAYAFGFNSLSDDNGDVLGFEFGKGGIELAGIGSEVVKLDGEVGRRRHGNTNEGDGSVRETTTNGFEGEISGEINITMWFVMGVFHTGSNGAIV